MTTHVTYKPHYCDKRYGEYVADKIYHMRLFGIPRNIPAVSNILIGRMNSFLLPDDSVYLCNGAFELYPVYYKKPKAKIVTMMKELTFWLFDKMAPYKQKFLEKLFSVNTGIITDTEMMKMLIEKHVDAQIEIVNPFCAQPFLENRPKLDSKKIIFIGSFESPNKGYNELVQAFKLLREEDGQWELFLVGQRGSEFVKERIEGMHITDRVPSLKPYLSQCSVYVHPAHFEPFGITVLEAMSAGLIPVVTRKTGMSEVLQKNRMGNLIMESNSPETIAAKIKEVYNYSSGRKKSISAKCRGIVKKGYLEKEGLKDFRKKFGRIVG